MTTPNDVRIAPRGLFPRTHWSALLLDGHGRGASLEAVYETYRQPLTLFLLCQRYPPEDAAGLVHGFIARLAYYDSLAEVGPEKGRFRTFLITSLKHFLSDERDRSTAAKRGGGRPLLSLEELAGRQGVDPALISERGAEWAYDRAWAVAVMDEALRELERELGSAGRGALFKVLAPLLHEVREPQSYRAPAAELGTTEGAQR